jgi:hypothetical protein
MKRPSFQFYPADWRNNANLRRCSPAARGGWMDVLCLLHDSDEYGVLRWPLADIAQAAGVPMELLRELVEKRVLKGGDGGCGDFVFTPRHSRCAGEPVTLITACCGPCWYCSRLVRDEYVRSCRGKETRFEKSADRLAPVVAKPEKKSVVDAVATADAAPIPPIGAAPKPPFGDGSTSSSSLKNMCVFVGDEALFDDPRAVPVPVAFPYPERLRVELENAGQAPPSAAHLQAQLAQFRLHFRGKRMSLSVWYSKLLRWLLRNPEAGEDNHAGTPTHQRRPGQDQKRQHSGFAAGDAISERWARGADG